MDAMIEVRELSKRFGGKAAVRDLSFDVRPGRVTGFLGPNGAGKSTTMRLILGLGRPDRGQVLIGGRQYPTLRNPLHHVGALLDAGDVHGGRTAFDHLHALAAANRIGIARVRQVLETVGLQEVAHKRAGGFSLGMRQRLGIAAALLGDPPVLMFDEPVNGLDAEGVRWMRTLMRSLAAEGRTVFVSSHLMSEMALTADHLVVIGRGKLITDTSTTEFIGSAAPTSARVRSPRADHLARLLTQHGAQVTPSGPAALTVTGLDTDTIGDLAMAGHITLHELTTGTVSLEEAFLALVGEHVEFHGQEA